MTNNKNNINSEEKNMLLEDLEKEMEKEREAERKAQEEESGNIEENDDEHDDEDTQVQEEEIDEEYEEEDEEIEEIVVKKKKAKKSKKKRKPISATALFAAAFVFFIFIIILLIFLLAIAGSDNPIFQNFGIEPYEVKEFLLELVNKVFMVIVVLMLLFVAIGIFRGYSLPEEKKKKRRGSFIFGGVAGALLFISILLWGGAAAFINFFVTEGVGQSNIQILGFESGEDIVAPLDITFSAEDIKKQFLRQGKQVIGLQWSKDAGQTYSRSSINDTHTFQFFKKGIQTILLETELTDGTVQSFERSFKIDDATFILSPQKPTINQKTELNAASLFEGNALYKWDFDGDGIYEQESRSSKINHIFSRKGEQTVYLRIESSNDSIERYQRTFIVLGESQKSIDAVINIDKKTEGQAPYQLTFDANQSYSEYGNITDYSWRIGSNTQKNGISITHTFEQPGTYPVILEIKNEDNNSDTEELEIIITKGNSAPNAIIMSKPPFQEDKNFLQGYIPFEATFYGHKSTDPDENITQYQWKIKDSEGNELETSFGDEYSSVFRKEGEYKLILTVSDQLGEVSEKTLDISIKEPPVIPVLKAFPESGTAPLIVEFNASESTCKLDGCKILSYLWDFDDGREPVQSGAHISHQFSKPGTYEVEMTAITNTGEEASILSYISVTDSPFIACFQSSRTSGEVPLKITFDPTMCSKGDIEKYKWDFGDGFISETRKPTHIFREPGTYKVILNTFSNDGRVGKMEEEITVTIPSNNQ